MQKFSLVTNFRGQASPWKLNPQKFTHEELSTVITVGYSHPRKLISSKILPTKYCDHKNLFIYNIYHTTCQTNHMSAKIIYE